MSKTTTVVRDGRTITLPTPTLAEVVAELEWRAFPRKSRPAREGTWATTGPATRFYEPELKVLRESLTTPAPAPKAKATTTPKRQTVQQKAAARAVEVASALAAQNGGFVKAKIREQAKAKADPRAYLKAHA